MAHVKATAGKGPPCEQCGRGRRIAGERFCHGCRNNLVAAMTAAGYLTHVPGDPRRVPERPARNDDDNPAGDNAARAREGD